MKTWQIEIEGNKHIVDVQNSSFLGGGCVMLDGLRTCEWGLSVYGLPAQIKFEIQGKKAEINFPRPYGRGIACFNFVALHL